jgi:hypothetical protein
MKCPTKQRHRDSSTNCVVSGHEPRSNSSQRITTAKTGAVPTKALGMMLVTASGASIVWRRQLRSFTRKLNSHGANWILRQHEKYLISGSMEDSFVAWLERCQHAGTTS